MVDEIWRRETAVSRVVVPPRDQLDALPEPLIRSSDEHAVIVTRGTFPIRAIVKIAQCRPGADIEPGGTERPQIIDVCITPGEMAVLDLFDQRLPSNGRYTSTLISLQKSGGR